MIIGLLEMNGLECEEGTERNRENLIKEKCQNYFKDSYKKE